MSGLALAVVLAIADADSSYEKTLIDWALEQHQAALEPEPEGKTIEVVLSAREDVFSQSDPVPTWLNVFHAKSRENVALREVLLKVGEVWSSEKAAETERNLRSLVVFAVAKVVPIKAPGGGVGVLVVTKDRWSFRANWSYLLVGTVLEYLHVPITEVNFLGQAVQLTLDPELRRDTLILGQQVVWPRIANSRLLVNERLGVVFNRATGKAEGTYGTAQVRLPLITLDQQWGFNAFADWDLRRVRVFRGSRVWELPYPNEQAPERTVPYVFDFRRLDVAALVSRRFGTGSDWRADLTGGLAGYVHQSSPPQEESLPDSVRDWFVSTRLPRSEDAVYFYAAATVFRARYIQLHDIETYGLTEDFQVGPRLIAAAKWAVPVIAPSSFLELGASLRWRFLFRDDFLIVYGAAAARFAPGGRVVNQHYAAEVLNFSPPFEAGRLVTRVTAEFRRNDLNNNTFVLGAGQGLRGTPSGALAGRNMVLGNFEYRARPFNITTTRVGLVLFYDVGSAFDDRPELTHTVGAGLRILIPQLNIAVIRLDLGWVIGADDSRLSADRFSSSFGQVTQLRSDFFDDPL